MSAIQRMRREVSELRLAASIAAGFGLMDNAARLQERAGQIEAEMERQSLTAVECLVGRGPA